MKKIYLHFILLFVISNVSAQFQIYNFQLSNPLNASQLVDKLVGTGVTYSNATFSGSYGGTQAGNAAYFAGGTSIVGLNSGIILTTGNAGRHWYTGTFIAGPNLYSDIGTATNTGSDATLNSIIGDITYDKAVLEFDFIPESNYIQFRYVFASEEYLEYVGTQYNDVFAFFVTSLEADGYNYNNYNIALIPGTSTPVSINNVNHQTNSNYFIDNTSGSRAIEYDGLTTVLTAACPVTPCKRYHMKIAIADVGDQWWDSGVLLEENSFSSPTINNVYYTTTNSQVGGGVDIVEGCSNGQIQLNLTFATPMNRNIPIVISGTAQLGVDYYTIPDISGTYTPPNNYYVTIPAGQSSFTLTVVPIQDGVIESTETISFGIQSNLCGTPNYHYLTINLLDNSLPFSTSLPPMVNICNGNSTTLTVGLNGGQSPYTYLWSSGHNQQSITVNPSTNTTYTVTVVDGCGVSSITSSTVQVNPVPSAIPSTTNQILCNGSTTSININSNVQNATYTWTATGSSNIYGYSNGTGSTIQQTLWTNNNSSGSVTYTIVASAAGCNSSPVDVNVVVHPNPTINSVDVVPNTMCIGIPNGQVTINASGGTPPLNYSLDGGVLQSNNVFTQVGTGNHNAMVQDINGCQALYTNIQVPGPSGPIINQIQTTNLLCYGANSGSIVIDATNAVLYSIDNGQSWSNTNVFTNLSAGTYSILVQDAGHCNTASVAVITSPSQITATFTTQDEFCGILGSAVVHVTGGTPGYSYLWSNNQTTESIYNITGGTYTVTVTDANNCTAEFSVNIGNTPAPVINSIITTNPTCYGVSNGSLQIDATGGQLYSIDGGNTWSSSSTFNNLWSGNYVVIVRDSNGCTDQDMVELTSPSAITAEITTEPEVCGTPGWASITVSGGIPPYEYVWTTGDTTSSIHNIYHGTYTVTVTDANNCTVTFSANVNYQGSNVQVNYVVQDVRCHGDSTGKITITISNVVGTYTINWSHTGDTSQVQENLPAGIYNVTVTDEWGCTAVTSIPVLQPQPITANYQITPITCYNANDGAITITTTTGGVSPYTYMWSNGGNGTTISGLVNGNYSVTIIDNNGCSYTIGGIEIINPMPLVVQTTSINPICHNGNEGMIIANVEGGTPPYQYQWEGGVNNDTLSNISSGIYTVTIVDSHYCTATATGQLLNPPDIIVSGEVEIVNYIGSINLSVEGGILPYSYNWSNGMTTEDISNLGGGTFIVTVTDGNGCTKVSSFYVDIPLDIPTVITPNGDGKNDDFQIVGIQGFKEVLIEIYNRWGDKLFEYKGSGLEYLNVNKRWNGKYNGKDLPMGQYVFIIKLDNLDPITGVVSIIY